MARTTIAVLLLLASATAGAVDVTTCGQTVLQGETGDLVADLDCTGFGQASVFLQTGATLRMNGFSLIGGLQGIATYPGKKGGPVSYVVGPGAITGIASSPVTPGCAIFASNKLSVEGVDIHGNDCGIRTFYGFKLTLTDVSITGNAGDGVFYTSLVGNGRIQAERVHISNNAGSGIVSAGKIDLRDATITGNGVAGVVSERKTIKGRNAIVTGNGPGGDLAAYRKPRLILLSACDHSVNLKSGGTFGLCALD